MAATRRAARAFRREQEQEEGEDVWWGLEDEEVGEQEENQARAPACTKRPPPLSPAPSRPGSAVKRPRRGAHPAFVDTDAEAEEEDDAEDEEEDDDVVPSRRRPQHFCCMVDTLSRISDAAHALRRMERDMSSVRADLCETEARMMAWMASAEGEQQQQQQQLQPRQQTGGGLGEARDSYERDGFVVSDDEAD